MTANELLYGFEYEYLPRLFYARTETVTFVMAQEPDAPHRYLNDYRVKMNGDEGDDIFREEDFTCGTRWAKAPHVAVGIDFPVPEDGEGFAERAYMFTDIEWEDMRYYLLVRNDDTPADKAELWSISPSGERSMLGLCPEDPDESVRVCRDLYLSKAESEKSLN